MRLTRPVLTRKVAKGSSVDVTPGNSTMIRSVPWASTVAPTNPAFAKRVWRIATAFCMASASPGPGVTDANSRWSRDGRGEETATDGVGCEAESDGSALVRPSTIR